MISISISNQSDDGSVVSLKCENGTHEADLFVDCTGFHSELLGKVMGVHYNSYANTLINHRAIAQIPYTDKNKQLTSYTNNVTMNNLVGVTRYLFGMDYRWDMFIV